jgi:UDP-GlcNAc:undecaprenyl-phosphate GlcNAc-1-phosphate transferase
VVLHSRAAAQVTQNDDGRSHVSVYLILLLSAAALAMVLTPLVARGSSAVGLVDAPGGRKVHPQSRSRFGGLAIVAAAAAATGIILPLTEGFWVLAPAWPILVGGALVFAVGLADDVRSLSPWPKLVVEIAAAVVVTGSGSLIERVTVMGTTADIGWLALPISLVWVVGLTNAFNLIDGIDGLAAGVAIIAGATCALILILRGHAAEAVILAALVGGAVGFLLYNFQPASIFLGDGGSLLFGFVLAATAITGWQKGATALATTVPLLVFALPLADLASSVWRRLKTRPPKDAPSIRAALRRIVEPDRGHIHHRLLALGWSPRKVVLVLYGVTLLLSAAALATARLDR